MADQHALRPASYDALVIGGGITGAGVLRDLALRGVKSLLVEKGRPARGTTINSSHLIHGGLRYLLYDRFTTRATCWDAGHIVRIARPLLTRLPILWPVYRGHAHGLAAVETLLEEYDRFSRWKEGLPHLRLSAADTLRVFPSLSPEGLQGAVVFDEWWVDPEALVKANLDAAVREGADVRLDTEVVGFLKGNHRIEGARLRPAGKKPEEEVLAKCLVNAAGPWVDHVAGLAGVPAPLRLRQGVHLVYDKPLDFLAASGRPVGLLLQAEDKRYVFILPHGKTVLVGPTDTPTDRSPDALVPEEAEKSYLLAAVKRYFPAFPENYDRVIVGARPILGQAGSEKLLSREFAVVDHGLRDGVPGLVTVAGGKMSDFRLMGEATGDAVVNILRRAAPSRSRLVALDDKPLEGVPEGTPPPSRAKEFLREHPRLREVHALAHLGAAFLLNAGRSRPEASFQDFKRHYA
jgi:glycerol-3-phosphate dehydrogenase